MEILWLRSNSLVKLEILRVLLPSRLAPSAAGACGSACGRLTAPARSSRSYAGIVLRKVRKRKIRRWLAIGGTAEFRHEERCRPGSRQNFLSERKLSNTAISRESGRLQVLMFSTVTISQSFQ